MGDTAYGSDERERDAPLGEALLLMGDFWSVHVIRAIFVGTRRFQDIRDRLGISDPVLSRRLSRLVDAGILETSRYQDRPVRHEYLLTDAGKDLWGVMVAMWAWDRRWITGPQRLSGIDLRHLSCGETTRPVFGCGRCGAIGVTARDVSGTADHLLLSGLTRRRGRRSAMADGMATSTGILGDQWSILVLSDALMGSRHFTEFRSGLGISPVTLNDRLTSFVERGVMSRVSVSEGARRQVYRLTPMGLDFFTITTMINAWAQHWLAEDGRSGLVIRHLACGQEILPRLTCDSCTRPLAREAIRFESDGKALGGSFLLPQRLDRSRLSAAKSAHRQQGAGK